MSFITKIIEWWKLRNERCSTCGWFLHPHKRGLASINLMHHGITDKENGKKFFVCVRCALYCEQRNIIIKNGEAIWHASS